MTALRASRWRLCGFVACASAPSGAWSAPMTYDFATEERSHVRHPHDPAENAARADTQPQTDTQSHRLRASACVPLDRRCAHVMLSKIARHEEIYCGLPS